MMTRARACARAGGIRDSDQCRNQLGPGTRACRICAPCRRPRARAHACQHRQRCSRSMRTHAHVHACTNARIHACACACMYRTHERARAHTHTQAHTHTYTYAASISYRRPAPGEASGRDGGDANTAGTRHPRRLTASIPEELSKQDLAGAFLVCSIGG